MCTLFSIWICALKEWLRVPLFIYRKAERATTGQESGTLAEAQALLQDTNDDDDDVVNGQIVFGNDVETDDDEQPLVWWSKIY